MKRVVSVSVFFIVIGMIVLLAGCGSNKKETALLDWLQSIKKDNTEIYLLDLNDMEDSGSLFAVTLSEEGSLIMLPGGIHERMPPAALLGSESTKPPLFKFQFSRSFVRKIYKARLKKISVTSVTFY